MMSSTIGTICVVTFWELCPDAIELLLDFKFSLMNNYMEPSRYPTDETTHCQRISDENRGSDQNRMTSDKFGAFGQRVGRVRPILIP